MVGNDRGMESTDPWPLRHLVLRAPRLELRPDDDAGLLELATEALHGVHSPERMPFGSPWTDVPSDELGPNIMRHHWRVRAQLDSADWRLNFLVRRNGRVIGTQGLSGKRFPVVRQVSTGSWIGLRHQGKGFGTQARAAVLQFAFHHLGAVQARSVAFADNSASLAVSRKLGYVEGGTSRVERRGEPADEIRLLLSGERFAEHCPEWAVEVDGLARCGHMLGI
jgi:RimJ/RimL family protein N-acetyltransferase